MLTQLVAGELSMFHVTPLGSLCVISLGCPFGIFAAINHSQEYGFRLRPGGGLGDVPHREPPKATRC